MKRCMIFAAGNFCADGVIGKTLEMIVAQCEDSFCIAADGGLDLIQELNIVPDLIIGDMDSLQSDDMLERFAQNKAVQIKRLPVEKDDTDMLAAIREGLKAGCDSFELYGALGGRIDHTLANIQCLVFLLNNGAYGVLYGKGQRIELVRNSRICFSKEMRRENRRLSVFALGKDACGVTEKGLKYTLDEVIVRTDFPIGISNEFTDCESFVEVRDGTLLICVEDLQE